MSVFLLLYALAVADKVSIGHPPDEIAHLSYVQDASQGWPVPDYREGTIRDTREPNYLLHPPAYYSLLGTMVRLTGIEVFPEYKTLRFASALIFALGFFFLLSSANLLGAPPGLMAAMTLASCAVPMVPYLVGSVNNDSLSFTAFNLFFYGFVRTELIDEDLSWPGGLALSIGLILSPLTKLTGATYIVLFLLAYIALNRTRMMPLLKDKRYLGIALAVFSTAGLYYLVTKLWFGTISPSPGPLYTPIAPDQSLSFWDYSRQFVRIMTERLPAIMSSASFHPIGGEMKVWFYAMLIISPCIAFVVRFFKPLRSADLSPRWVATLDALAIALFFMLIVHVLRGWEAYQVLGRLTSGWQPRYYLFLLPLLFGVFLLVRPRSVLVTLVSYVLVALALSNYWSGVPKMFAHLDRAYGSGQTINVQMASNQGANRVDYLLSQQPVLVKFDEVEFSDLRLTLRGWGVDDNSKRPIDRLLVIKRNFLVLEIPVWAPRADVARSVSERSYFSGFGVSKTVTTEYLICNAGFYAEYQGRLHAISNPVECDN
jgi:hypothetical protein